MEQLHRGPVFDVVTRRQSSYVLRGGPGIFRALGHDIVCVREGPFWAPGRARCARRGSWEGEASKDDTGIVNCFVYLYIGAICSKMCVILTARVDSLKEGVAMCFNLERKHVSGLRGDAVVITRYLKTNPWNELAGPSQSSVFGVVARG